MKKVLMFFLYICPIMGQLEIELAQLSIELEILYTLISQPPELDKELESTFSTISILFENYQTLKTTAQGQTILEQLDQTINKISQSSYAPLLKEYNRIADTEDQILATELQSPEAFASWYGQEIMRPTLQEIEKVYKDAQFTRIDSITTVSVLESLLNELSAFQAKIEEAKSFIPSYTGWTYEDLQATPPTYESLLAWSTEKKDEITARIEEIASLEVPSFIPTKAGTLSKATYCKFPVGTNITINGKTLTIGTSDFTPYQDAQGNLLNVTSVTAFSQMGDDGLISIKGGKTYFIPANAIAMEISWLNTLPEESGWCSS